MCVRVVALQAYAQQPVVGDREHILLFLSNVSLPAPRSSNASSSGATLQLPSQQAWVGYNPGVAARSILALAGRAGPPVGRNERVTLDCGYHHLVVEIRPGMPKDALQLQQLVLSNLPQGPGAEVPSQVRAVPATLLTSMLWSFKRCARGPEGVRTVCVSGQSCA
jgi:hypothetical protein